MIQEARNLKKYEFRKSYTYHEDCGNQGFYSFMN